MKKLSLILLLIISSFSLSAQYDGPFAPNYKEIETNIKSSNSEYFYNNLMERYLSGDTTLTIYQQRHLYYGYVFHENYNPVDNSEYNQLLSDVLSKQHLSNEDFTNIEKYAGRLLQEDPFNMRALNAQLLVYAQRDEAAPYRSVATKRNIIERAITSSGDGMSKKSSYYVIRVAHEYDILGFLGYKYGGSEKIEKGCKCNSLTVKQNPFGVEKIYFDISPVLKYANRKGKQKL